MNRLLIAIVFVLSIPVTSYSAYPGGCVQIFYIKDNTATSTGTQWAVPSFTFDSTTGVLSQSSVTRLSSGQTNSLYQIAVYYFDNGGWVKKGVDIQFTGWDSTIMPLLENLSAVRVTEAAAFSYVTPQLLLSKMPGCPVPTCSSKTGQVNYDLQNYSNPSSPPVGGNACYDDCQQSAEILWTDCIGSSCIASVKYTATGQSCGVETSVDNLQTDPPKRCTDEINKKIQQCGGSLKVLSFDFETCTGQCTPDSCADQWKTLVNKCGGVMAVSTWDASTCSGTCVNDPLPNASQPDSEAVPTNVTTKKTTNPDGSSEVTNVTVYNVDGNPYAETTTITYDADGNETGKTTSTSTGSAGTGTGTGDTDTQYFSAIENSGFSEPYNPGEFDIPARFTTFLNNVKSSGLFSFSNDFFNSLPGGGSPIYEIEGGMFGSHSIDLSETMSGGLAVVKTVLLALFGFLSIRAVIMKR